MIFVLERVTDPDIEPITLAEAKVSLRTFASSTNEDGEITGMITAAREWVEDYTGRALIDQSWRLTLNADPRRWGFGHVNGPWMSWGSRGLYAGSILWTRLTEVMLRKSPALSIASFVTVDAAGAETAVDPASWQLREQDSKWPRIAMINGSLMHNATYRITFRAGFADRDASPQQDEAAVPETFKRAMKLWMQAHYDRDPVTMPLLLDAAEKMMDRECTQAGFA